MQISSLMIGVLAFGQVQVDSRVDYIREASTTRTNQWARGEAVWKHQSFQGGTASDGTVLEQRVRWDEDRSRGDTRLLQAPAEVQSGTMAWTGSSVVVTREALMFLSQQTLQVNGGQAEDVASLEIRNPPDGTSSGPGDLIGLLPKSIVWSQAKVESEADATIELSLRDTMGRTLRVGFSKAHELCPYWIETAEKDLSTSRTEYSEFRRAGGAWYPARSVLTVLNSDGTIRFRGEWMLQELSLNSTRHSDSLFAFTVTEKTQVKDLRGQGTPGSQINEVVP